MEIMLVDESYDLDKASKHRSFVLAGLIVDIKNLLDVENELDEIKEKNGLETLRDLRVKKLKDENQTSKLDISKNISAVLEDNDCIIKAMVLTGNSLYAEGLHAYYNRCMHALVDRFSLHLRKHGEKGMIILDSLDQRREHKFGKTHYLYMKTFSITWYGNTVEDFRRRILPTLFFGDDETSSVLQSVDLISKGLQSAVTNSLENNPRIDVNKLNEFNPFLNIYWKLFDRSVAGKLDGWGIKINP